MRLTAGVRIKKWYISFLSKEKKNLPEGCLFFVLLLLSFIFAIIVRLRNFLYDKKILEVSKLNKKIISVGNLSWSGSGKTSFVVSLHKRLFSDFKVASVTKGYAQDEYLLIKNEVTDVFDAKDRVGLIKKLSDSFNLFILDDGFQYRKLYRNLDIVLIKREDLTRKIFLIPASSFREPISSLNRADIVVITYCGKEGFLENRAKILKENKNLKIFYADYLPVGFLDKNKDFVPIDYFKERKFGLLTAIGYPEGFLNKLSEAGLKPGKTLVFPDHYQFGAEELQKIENDFFRAGIEDIVITYKDYYHLNFTGSKLNYFIFRVELKIADEEDFFKAVKEKLDALNSSTS